MTSDQRITGGTVRIKATRNIRAITEPDVVLDEATDFRPLLRAIEEAERLYKEAALKSSRNDLWMALQPSIVEITIAEGQSIIESFQNRIQKNGTVYNFSLRFNGLDYSVVLELFRCG